MIVIKRHQTMVELVIAMGLTMLILAVLTFFYRQIDVINIALEKTEQQTFRMRYLGNRLADILPKATSERNAKRDFYFFTDNDNTGTLFKAGSSSLVFTYDNGVNLDAKFSSHVLGRLYLDQQSRLCLVTVPSTKNWDATFPPVKKEILLENVVSLSFSFFIAPERKEREQYIKTKEIQAGRQTTQPEPQNSWINEWKYEYNQLPSIVKIRIVQKVDQGEQTLLFAFPMPNSNKFIMYIE